MPVSLSSVMLVSVTPDTTEGPRLNKVKTIVKNEVYQKSLEKMQTLNTIVSLPGPECHLGSSDCIPLF